MEQYKELQNEKIDFKKLGYDIRIRVNKEKLVLTEVFKEEAQKLKKPDILALALEVAPNKSLSEAFVIIYNAFDMTPEKLENEIKDFMLGGRWDRFSYA